MLGDPGLSLTRVRYIYLRIVDDHNLMVKEGKASRPYSYGVR
jgi:hypothetical protein